MRALPTSLRHASAAERMAQSVRHRAQPGRAAPLVLTRLAALVLALLALLAPRLAAAHAETAALAHLAAHAHLTALAITPQHGTTPIPPGCAERAPSSARASTALGGIDGASAPRARALAMGGRTWDRDGRLLEKRSKPLTPDAGQDSVWQYTWNAAGLLHRARSSDGTIVECAYDPFARRIEKRVYEQKSPLGAPTLQARTRFVWDGDVLVHELREQGLASGDPVVEERTYWFEDGGFEPLAHREKRVDDVGRESGGWFHYKNDPIGTPERLVAEDGSVAAEYERKAWGQLEQRAGAKASTPIRLQGQYWDEETGLAYNRWRYYDGEGRFVSADPLGLRAGIHSVRFAASPSYIDPLGLLPKIKFPEEDLYQPTHPGERMSNRDDG